MSVAWLVHAGLNAALLELVEHGQTKICNALHLAGWEKVDVVRALLARGAQVNYKGNKGKLHY